METFVPYEKLSKKEKRKIDLQQRSTWGSFDPVTRKPVSKRIYNRKRTPKWQSSI